MKILDSNFKTMQLRRRKSILWDLQMLIWTPAVFFCISFSSFAMCAETENPKAVWQEVLTAVKAIKNPTCGKGSALVSFTGRMGDPEIRLAIVDFEFKDDLSRSEMFLTTDNGEKGKRGTVWVQGKEYAIVYNPFMVALEPKPIRQFYRKVGYDFHADTFSRLSNHPVSFLLERRANGPGTFSAERVGNSILNLVGRYEDPNQRVYHLLSFDISEEYRLIFAKDNIEFLNDHKKDINETHTIEWAKYGSEWYIKSAKLECVYWDKDINAPTTGTIEVVIRNFDPNAIIDTNDFKLEGLGIPKGTLIRDQISNRQYKYGSQ